MELLPVWCPVSHFLISSEYFHAEFLEIWHAGLKPFCSKHSEMQFANLQQAQWDAFCKLAASTVGCTLHAVSRIVLCLFFFFLSCQDCNTAGISYQEQADISQMELVLSDEDKSASIKMLQSQPCIWNFSVEAYHNRNRIHKRYNSTAHFIGNGMTGEFVYKLLTEHF